MHDRDSIVDYLHAKLETWDDIYALWIEGSIPQGFADGFSDLDLWVCTDDSKIFTIYDEIERVLSDIAPIDFRYVVKSKGDLGQVIYHLDGMNEFLTIDINSQGVGRNASLVRGIDDAQVIFDKIGVVKFKDRDTTSIDLEAKRRKLRGFYKQMYPSLLKNIRRHKNLESLYYYHLILQYATKFLRLKYGWPEKIDFDLKHIYRDIPEADAASLERFYSFPIDDIETTLPELEEWLKNL